MARDTGLRRGRLGALAWYPADCRRTAPVGVAAAGITLELSLAPVLHSLGLGLVAWLAVTAAWSAFGPRGFVPLFVVAGVYLLGPLWTRVRYTVGTDGVSGASVRTTGPLSVSSSGT